MPKFAWLMALCLMCLSVVGEDGHDISKRSFYLLFPRNTIFQFSIKKLWIIFPNKLCYHVNGLHRVVHLRTGHRHFKFTYGLTVPVVLPRRSINISWCYQAQYNLPFNISNFYPNTIAVRQSSFTFDLPRIKFYEYLAKFLSNFGLHGEHCVFRSICEVAEIPMYQKDDSVLEKIVEFLFTPSLELNPNSTSKDLKDEYKPGFTHRLLKAEELGKSEGNCDEKYSKCLMSIVDLMTVLYVT